MYRLDTVGMEFETTSRLHNDFYRDELFSKYFRNTHDASIESQIILLKNNIYMLDSEEAPSIFSGLERGTAGVELVSIPLNFEEMTGAVSLLTKKLFKFGAKDEEERAGIHIHCAYPISHKILVNTVRLGLSFESLFFHLGGMGYNFRGATNNSIFCRPLSSFGPPIVKNRYSDWIQLLDIEHLLNSKDITSFWRAFGGIDVNNPPNRYHPSRYFFLNLFSAFLHSTLEFRIFNTTLNSDYILACMRFCQEFTNLALQSKNPFDFVSSVYEPIMSPQELLDKFCMHTNIEPEWQKILFTMLEKTPKIELPSKYIMTHLRDYTTIDNDWDAKKFSSEDFSSSGFIDIHNMLPNSEPRLVISEQPRIRRPRVIPESLVLVEEGIFDEERESDEERDERESDEERLEREEVEEVERRERAIWTTSQPQSNLTSNSAGNFASYTVSSTDSTSPF